VLSSDPYNQYMSRLPMKTFEYASNTRRRLPFSTGALHPDLQSPYASLEI